MLKAKTILAVFGLAMTFSFLVLCFMTFVVLPNDVLRKSSFYRTQGLPLGKRRSALSSASINRQKINRFLKTNNNTEGRFAIRHVVEIDGEEKKKKKKKKSVTSQFPLLRVRPGHHNRMGDVVASPQVDRILLAKTLRDHGMHPERARALISALLDEDKKH